MAGFDQALKVLVWQRDGGACFHCGVAVWEGDVHHRRARGMGGRDARWEWMNHVSVLVLLCRDSHNWIEAHPDAARSMGFRLDVGDDPTDVLVRSWDGLWYRLHGEDFKTPVAGLLRPLVGEAPPRWSEVMAAG